VNFQYESTDFPDSSFSELSKGGASAKAPAPKYAAVLVTGRRVHGDGYHGVPQRQKQRRQEHERGRGRDEGERRPMPDVGRGGRVTQRPVTEAQSAVARRRLLHTDQRQRETVIQVVRTRSHVVTRTCRKPQIQKQELSNC